VERGVEMKKIVLHGRKVTGGYAEGEALVTHDTISGWGGINPLDGTIIEKRHELVGQSFKGKVLVFPGAKGSSGWSITFHIMRLAGNAPRAMVFKEMTSKVALGSVVAHIPAMTDLDQDPLEVIDNGDWVTVEADKGMIEVIKKRGIAI
jgi:predicted aconitase with swiveling domain